MPSVRVTSAQKSMLKRAMRVLALERGRPFTQGEAVAQLARSVTWMEPMCRRDKKRRKALADLGPLFDTRIVLDGMGPTTAEDIDKVVCGGE